MSVLVWVLLGLVVVLGGTICALIIMVRRLAADLSSVVNGLADLSRRTLRRVLQRMTPMSLSSSPMGLFCRR